jgi:hypothetical protein
VHKRVKQQITTPPTTLLPSCGIGAIFGYTLEASAPFKRSTTMKLQHIQAALKQVERSYLTPTLDWDISGTENPVYTLMAEAEIERKYKFTVSLNASEFIVRKLQFQSAFLGWKQVSFDTFRHAA